MDRIRVGLIAAGLALGIGLNVTVAPQLMTPRAPVFNGADIAENWEWRSMAIEMHGWWLWEQFPYATASHVGLSVPPGNPEALEVGMEFDQWMDEFFTTTLDTELPPLDLTELGIRDQLLAHSKVYSRIHCRTGQDMVQKDTCYYFVAWSPELLTSEPPHFIGVLTSDSESDEEMALVEQNLLEQISPVPLDELVSIDEVKMS